MTLVPAPRRIVFLAYDGILSIDLCGPLEVFDMARRLLADRYPSAPRAYELEVVAWTPDRVQTTGGLPLHVPASARGLRGSIDTLLVPGGLSSRKFGAQPDVRDWLREKSALARRVASVCTGSELLASAGLVDGRRITSHWAACDRLARHYPAVTVDPEPIFVKSDKFYTSAGATAGMDLALALIEEDWGTELSLGVARWLVMFLKRPGTQAQHSVQLDGQSDQTHALNELRAWIGEHLTTDLGIDRLAQRAGMSPRNLCRAFQRHTGMTPSKFVEAARIEAAQRWLAQSDHGLDEVARRSGFGSAETLRRSFRRCLGVAPSHYRERQRVGVRRASN
jgi:transcriptional regulator GlxA family with amidase domain